MGNTVRRTVTSIIREIKDKSTSGDYIYRGERENYDDVSSALYREYIKIREHIEFDVENFDLRIVEKEMLKVVKKHIGESPTGALENFSDIINMKGTLKFDWEISITGTIEEAVEREILTELQHYGGITNLIDFTTDFLIAIFFACSGNPKDDGRVILLQKTKSIENMILHPQNPRHRVVAQKSVFLHPPKGFVDVSANSIVTIPAHLKGRFLKYLRKFHGISTETIYNDIHGFIRNQNIQQNAYIQFNLALTFQFRGYHAEPGPEKQQAYKDAIEHYNQAIDLNPELDVAYGNRAECWLHLEKWGEARMDFSTAQNLGYDIRSAFRNDYENITDFEGRTGTKLPKYIVNMLEG